MHTLEYYAAMEKSEVLAYTTVGIDSENLMLSEISQTQEDRCFMTPCPWNI